MERVVLQRPGDLLTRIQKCFVFNFHNSTLIPPAGFLLSEDLDTTLGLILTEYGLNLRVPSSSYEGLESPKNAEKDTRNRPPVHGLVQ